MTPGTQISTPLPEFNEAVRFWWKLGWISFGGTASHIAIMHDYLVVKREWISDSEFLHALSHCMMLPGPEAQQLAIYIGWKLHGLRGGIIAGSLFVLPSTFVLLALSLIYVRFGHLSWMAAIFTGLKPAVLALVLLALFRVASRALRTPLQWAVVLIASLAMIAFHASLPAIMLCAVALGLFIGWRFPHLIAPSPTQQTSEPDQQNQLVTSNLLRSAAKITATAFLLWLIPLALLCLFARDSSFWKQLTFFFTRTAFITIGGSYTVIPYVAQIAVFKYHWLTQPQMLDGFALAETTPGPLIIVVAFVGFMAGFNHFHGSALMGAIALLATTFYTFLPCFLFVFAGAPLIERTHGNRRIEAVLKLIMAVVVAAILDLTVFLCRGVLFHPGPIQWHTIDWIALAWVGISIILLRALKTNIIAVIGLSILAGLLRWSLQAI